MSLNKEKLVLKKLFFLITAVILLASMACANDSEEANASNKGEVSDMKISIQITGNSGSHTLTATLSHLLAKKM